MGVHSSKEKRDKRKRNNKRKTGYGYQNMETVDVTEVDPYIEDGILLLPSEVVVLLLSFLSPKDLKVCARVCRKFLNAVNSASLWKLKCLREKIFIERYMAPHYPEDWKDFYFKRPYSRNLIKNCSGQDGLKYWKILRNGGHQWRVEKELKAPGSGEKPSELLREAGGAVSCFATSFDWCKKEQVIDLLAEGFSAAILDEMQPPLIVGEWYAARFDCGNTYSIKIQLLSDRKDKEQNRIAEFNPEPILTEQWADCSWKEIKHTFRNYGPGLRFIRFSHKSKDSQFWAGHYGAKMAASQVCFLFGDESLPR